MKRGMLVLLALATVLLVAHCGSNVQAGEVRTAQTQGGRVILYDTTSAWCERMVQETPAYKELSDVWNSATFFNNSGVKVAGCWLEKDPYVLMFFADGDRVVYSKEDFK